MAAQMFWPYVLMVLNIYNAGCKMISSHLVFCLFSWIVAIVMSEGDLVQDVLEKMQDAGAR